MRRVTDFTHLGRALDFRLGSNRFAFLAPLGAGLVAYVLDTRDLRRAAAAALATFAAWAIARELDPDRPRSASVAALLAVPATVLFGVPAPAALFVALVTTRILARSTGLAPKTTDLAVVTLGSIAVADTPWGWAAGIVLAFAVVRDATLPGAPPVNAGLWGLVLAVGVTGRVALAQGIGSWLVPDPASVFLLVVGAAAAVVVLEPLPILSLTDRTKQPLEPQRVREASIAGVVVFLLTAAAAGDAGVVAVAPLLLTYPAIAAVRRSSR